SLLSARAISGLSASGTKATVTVRGHGFSTGDWVSVAQSLPATYRGDYRITVVDADTFTYTLPTTPPSAGGFYGTATRIPASWNDQTTDPCYQWLNTSDGA